MRSLPSSLRAPRPLHPTSSIAAPWSRPPPALQVATPAPPPRPVPRLLQSSRLCRQGVFWKHSQDHVPALSVQLCRAFSLFLRMRCASHPDLQGARHHLPLFQPTPGSLRHAARHAAVGGFLHRLLPLPAAFPVPLTPSQLLAGF